MCAEQVLTWTMDQIADFLRPELYTIYNIRL